MPGRAEAIETECPPVAGHHQRAPADQARAEQGRCRGVAAAVTERIGVVSIDHDVGGVAAVARIAGELGGIAEVLAPAQAVAAVMAGATQPPHADSQAQSGRGDARPQFVDNADDLVPRNQWQARLGPLSVQDVQIGPADAARQHP